jgi:hypothetical protein
MAARVRHSLGADVGNPTIYYYPDETGTLETIDFGENLSDLQITQRRDVTDGFSRAGAFTRTTGRSYLEIRIVLENFTSVSLARSFDSLSAHLERGNPIGFALDSAKAWAGFVRGSSGSSGYYSPDRGQQRAVTTGNLFKSWSSSATIQSGDEIVVSSASPSGLRETKITSGVTSSTGKIVFFSSDSLVYTHRNAPIMVRSRDFYPALVMPQERVNEPIVESNHRISYTLDLTLVEDWGCIAAVDELGVGLRNNVGIPSDGFSLQEAIAEHRRGLNYSWTSPG